MNSSIFNFEHINALFAASTKTKAWGICLAVGFCGCLVFCSVLLLTLFPEKVPTNAKLPSQDTRILLLGNSQFAGLEIPFVTWPVMNASLEGSDYEIQEAILHAHASPGLRLLLLGFDNIPLHVTGLEDRKGDYLGILSRGVPWHKIPRLSLLEYADFYISYFPLLKPILVGPKLDTDYFNAFSFSDVYAADLPVMKIPKNFDPNRVIPPFFAPPSGGALKMKKYLENYAKRDGVEKNREAFHRIIEFCHANHIVLVLLRSPTVETFRNARIPEWDEELKQFYQDAVDKIGNDKIHLWNDDQSEIFPIYLFDDPNHLNWEGKLKYSEILKTRLGDFVTQIK